MIPMASFLCRNVASHERYRTKKSDSESDTPVRSYGACGKWTKWTFSKNMISMASFYVGMYLVNRGTEPRNQIRNRILQYGVMGGCGKWTKWTFSKIYDSYGFLFM